MNYARTVFALSVCVLVSLTVCPIWAIPPSASYRLGPGDVLQITVADHPEVTFAGQAAKASVFWGRWKSRELMRHPKDHPLGISLAPQGHNKWAAGEEESTLLSLSQGQQQRLSSPSYPP